MLSGQSMSMLSLKRQAIHSAHRLAGKAIPEKGVKSQTG